MASVTERLFGSHNRILLTGIIRENFWRSPGITFGIHQTTVAIQSYLAIHRLIEQLGNSGGRHCERGSVLADIDVTKTTYRNVSYITKVSDRPIISVGRILTQCTILGSGLGPFKRLYPVV